MKVAVIPARGGSTRLKNKNIHPLGGKPLIRWMTEAVIGSRCFDKVVISTDSDAIFDAAADLDVIRHQRDPSHATVSATALNAMLDYMENNPPDESEKESSIFSYFLPTCPFVSSQDIKNGVSMLEDSGEQCDMVVSMTQIPETIQLACVMKDQWVMPVFDNLEAGLTNSKFIKKYYKPSGAFYMGKWNKILEDRNFFKGNTKGVIIPPERSVDINNVSDIHFAESVLRSSS